VESVSRCNCTTRSTYKFVEQYSDTTGWPSQWCLHPDRVVVTVVSRPTEMDLTYSQGSYHFSTSNLNKVKS
jgi:hypothetical protein